MRFNNILDNIFANASGIKVLRFLILHKPEMTGREIARFSGISHMQAHRLLNSFEKEGIVIKKIVGKSNLFKINEKNVIVNVFMNYLFKKEKNLIADLINGLFLKIKDNILSIVFFGSVARGNERPDSDVDLFILVKDKKAEALINKELKNLEVIFHEKTGNRLSPLVMQIADYKKRAKSKKTIISEIISGKVIFGDTPDNIIK